VCLASPLCRCPLALASVSLAYTPAQPVCLAVRVPGAPGNTETASLSTALRMALSRGPGAVWHGLASDGRALKSTASPICASICVKSCMSGSHPFCVPFRQRRGRTIRICSPRTTFVSWHVFLYATALSLASVSCLDWPRFIAASIMLCLTGREK
jgi:hypothetical protein